MNISREDDSSLQEALEFVNASWTLVGQGDCTALQNIWKNIGVSNRSCTNDSSFMQIMWLDACIQTVRMSNKQYDMIVRTRPDVGVFAPVPWGQVDRLRVGYMEKDADSRADWFFTIPTSVIETWWDMVVDLYLLGDGGLPDYTIFSDDQSAAILSEVTFPAAIVRSSENVECFRIVSSEVLAKDCMNKAGSGYFKVLHPDKTP
jgi:hypothetical protein